MPNTLKALILMVAFIPGFAFATIANSAHDLSNYPGNTTHELCGFCHTPHSASTGQMALWNRSMPSTQYTWYFAPGATTGVQGVECGSCHDPHGVTAAGIDVPHFLRIGNASSALCISCPSE